MKSSFTIGMLRVACAALLLGWAPLAAATPDGPIFSPEIGSEHVFKIAYEGSARLDYAMLAATVAGQSRTGNTPQRQQLDAEQQTVDYDLGGFLHWRVLASGANGAVVAGRLQQARFKVNGAVDGRTALLERPFLLTFNERGAMTSFEFPRGMPDAIVRSVRAFVEPMQTVVPTATDSNVWSTREHSIDSTYRATYQLESSTGGFATLTKTKTAIANTSFLNVADTLPGAVSTDVHRAQTAVRWSLTDSVPTRIDAVEAVTLRAGKQFVSAHEHRFSLERVSLPVASLASDLATARSALRDRDFAMSRYYDTDSKMAGRVVGLGVDEIMARYFEVSAENNAASVRLLRNYLRTYPERSLDIARYANKLEKSPTEDGVAFMWASLASAGHREAQEVMLSVLRGTDWTDDSKEKALLALMDIEMPIARMPAEVWAFRQGIVVDNPSAAMLLSMATNVYGAIGDVRKDNPKITAEVVATLGQELGLTSDVKRQTFILDGLSNVGDEDAVTAIAAPLFDHSDARLRARAFATFRRMNGDKAFARFADRFASERDNLVRRNATRVALEMSSSPHRHRWASKLIKQEDDREIVGHMIEILGRDLDAYPEGEDDLRELLATSRDRRLRRMVYAHISPVRRGDR